MNTKRLIVLGVALVAASIAALLVRNVAGGGTPKVEAKAAPPVAMSEILVASANMQPGQAILPEQVRWQKWPTSAVDSSFITRVGMASEEDAVKGTVSRASLLAGQPITTTEIVHASAAGFMAATLNPGMRAVSITISTDSGAGGFILPNDHVDVILTRKFDVTNPPIIVAKPVLSNVRVLAIDQTIKQDKDAKTVLGKTATLEVTPAQAAMVESSQMAGQLSLALRPLGENTPLASNDTKTLDQQAASQPVNIIRYGIEAKSSAAQPGRPQ
jgi:pilus assembly protein CpaB